MNKNNTFSKTAQKVTSLLLITLLLFGSIGLNTFAADNAAGETLTFSEDGIYEYALGAAGSYVNMSDSDNIGSSSYSISNGYMVLGGGSVTGRAFFVFRNGVCIGQMNVAFADDHYASSYYSGELPLITDKYQNETPFALYNSGENLYLIDPNSSYVLRGDESETPFFSSVVVKTPITTEQITLPEVTSNSARSTTSKYLDVNIVANGLDPNNKGLCWAACVASIVMYRNSSYTNLSALGVYYDYYIYYGENNFVGTSSVISNAFAMYNTSINYQSSGVTFAQVKSYINQNRPIWAGLLATAPNIDDDRGHAVVICGYNTDGAGYWYQLMDPNSSSYCYVSITNPNSSTFTYVPSYSTDLSYTDIRTSFW